MSEFKSYYTGRPIDDVKNWDGKEQKEEIHSNHDQKEIIKLSPEFYGIGIDLKAAWRKLKNRSNNNLGKQNKTNKVNNLKWLLIIICFLPPIFFAWPLINSIVPFPFKAYISLGSDKEVELTKELNIPGSSEQISSTNILSSILKVQTQSMPVKLCIND